MENEKGRELGLLKRARESKERWVCREENKGKK